MTSAQIDWGEAAEATGDLFGVCPFVTAQRLLQGKWAILIMHHLEGGPVRFNELQRRMPKMTHATLARQLKQLEDEGLVERREYPGAVQRVEYSLTPMGTRFSPVLAEMRTWGLSYIEWMKEREAAS